MYVRTPMAMYIYNSLIDHVRHDITRLVCTAYSAVQKHEVAMLTQI